ncbi:MAG: DNA double-strand break repair nuclease NurA [Gudongella sp.]|nr:DNA double-strand break repair nuclease NurA [Gudongella sp.]
MDTLNRDLRDKLIRVNEEIKAKYNGIASNKEELRDFIKENIGDIYLSKKMKINELKEIEMLGGVTGVDGSTNRIGGSSPHYIEIYQGLAKNTKNKNDPLFLSEIYTPLIPEKSLIQREEEKEVDEKNIKLATIEIEVAIESIKRYKPYAIIMDGGLIRYNIYAGKKWLELVDICEEKDIILVGVIKDIKTSMIGEALKKSYNDISGELYDRELLFGLLEYGEVIEIDEDVNKKEPQGYASAFIRSSLQPMAIGIDIIESQKKYLKEMVRLVLTLTPENSRGVPLWLDIVDKEVKISDDMIKALMERYLDRAIYEKFFVSERDKRS